MQSYTRRQLKEDKFVTATSEAVHWSAEHRNTIIVIVIVVLGALAVTVGATAYLASRNEKAGIALADAIKTYNSPLRPPDAPAQPDLKSFTGARNRSKAAYDQFFQVANQYPRTRNGRFARYMAGITAMESGDNKQAEAELTQVSSSSDKDLTSLSKFALAALDRNTGKEAEALKLYREVIDANTVSVPKVTAQFELASMFETKQPDQALKLYEEIQKEESGNETGAAKTGGLAAMMGGSRSPAYETASRKIEAIKKGAPRQ